MTGIAAIDTAGGFDAMQAAKVNAGDAVSITGPVLTLRDASAARLAAAIEQGSPLPVALEGRVLYAVGPSPTMPGRVVGSAGPTTTARMAKYLPALLSSGVRAIIGKGELHGDDAAVFARHRALYLAATGGAGALLAQHIVSSALVAYDDLGAEALLELQLDRFPAVVIIDVAGRNFHEIARAAWKR